jgi:hypothetical protein
VHLLQTFLSHRVQPLRQRVSTMGLYPGPSWSDCPFSKELGHEKINTQFHKVLARRAGPTPLREGADSTRMSPFGSVFLLFTQFHPLTTCVFLRRVLGILTARDEGSPCLRMR